MTTGSLERHAAAPAPSLRTNLLLLPGAAVICDTSGRILERIPLGRGERLAAASFRVVASYRDYGRRVDLRRFGEASPFLRLESDAYPVLSPDGGLLLLVTGEAENFTLMDLVTPRTAGPFSPGELITDIAASAGRFALGLLDGRLVLLGPEVFEGKHPALVGHADSRIPIVKRVVFSPDGRRVACRHGYGPERITVRTVPRLRRLRDIPTGTEVRTRLEMVFSPLGRRILAESTAGFAVYSVPSGRRLFKYEPEAWRGKTFLNALWMDERRVAVSVRTPEAALVVLFDLKGRPVWSDRLEEPWVRLVDAGPDFLLGYSPGKAFLWAAEAAP